MKRTKFGLIAMIAMGMLSCAQHHSEMEIAQDVPQSEVRVVVDEEEIDMGFAQERVSQAPANHSFETYISSSAAVENPSDTARKMIRTANIQFKVKDVIQATYSIENIAIKQGGFVENTQLKSQINSRKETVIKKDSTLVTTYYTVLNTLILRVPNTQLDATLKEIAQLIEYLDFRTINAQDVTFDLYAKQLEQIRLAKHESRLMSAIDNKGRRLDDITVAENSLLLKQKQADDALIANLKIYDRINFSAINLSLYQNQSIKYEVIAKEQTVKPYAVPFGERFVEALKFGWTVLVETFLFLFRCWPVIVIAVLAMFGVKYYKKRTAKNQSQEKP